MTNRSKVKPFIYQYLVFPNASPSKTEVFSFSLDTRICENIIHGRKTIQRNEYMALLEFLASQIDDTNLLDVVSHDETMLLTERFLFQKDISDIGKYIKNEIHAYLNGDTSPMLNIHLSKLDIISIHPTGVWKHIGCPDISKFQIKKQSKI